MLSFLKRMGKCIGLYKEPPVLEHVKKGGESHWLMARLKQAEPNNPRTVDSREFLESLGFKILGIHNDLFYRTEPPSGWRFIPTADNPRYWTDILDEKGNKQAEEFSKQTPYDRRAFIRKR